LNINHPLEFFIKSCQNSQNTPVFFFLIINFLKIQAWISFSNSIKFLPTPNSLQFFSLKKKKKRKRKKGYGILKILTGINEKF
jgi:hypothetical protein